jgi:hypothetical protein
LAISRDQKYLSATVGQAQASRLKTGTGHRRK